MNIDLNVLDQLEKLTYALRTVYMGAGYARYRLGKFEEYDFYSRNKDFLISDNVITFMDTNGKLMALKPDVTLAIVKNLPDEPDTLHKLCYDENVYRVSRTTNSFMEIMQAGLECIGPVDMSCVGETLSLAAESLAVCSGSFVLEVSHLDILGAFLGAITDDRELKTALLKPVSEKNLHGVAALCAEYGADAEKAGPLCRLLKLSGPYGQVLGPLETLCAPLGLKKELADALAQRPVISAAIAEAREKGDLSENAEYDAAREAQGLLEVKISRLKDKLSNARVLDESQLTTDSVQLLSKVKVENLANKMVMQFTIVGETEADFSKGKLAVTTPIGKALVGHSVGETVEAQVPQGVMKFKILEISL